jgi:GTP-binding protein
LELKLLADVGLIGLPNAGKSSLLAAATRARPKIADYPFTTLSPNLGVAELGDGYPGFVLADIPGLIENASEGLGLGHEFLRHVDRCRLLIHVVEMQDEELSIKNNIDLINSELKKFNPELAERPQIIAVNKIDLAEWDYSECLILNSAFPISAATGERVRELMLKVAEELSKLPPIVHYEPEYIEPERFTETPDDIALSGGDSEYSIEGAWLERLLDRVNLQDPEGRAYFDQTLRRVGVYARLEEMGMQPGDTLTVYNWSFEYS